MDDKGHMEFSVLTLALPGRPSAPAGVLVYDAENEKLGVKLRRDWDEIAEPEDAEILSGMESHLKQLSVEMGAERAMEWLESTLSNVLHLGARSAVRSSGLDFTLHQLYREHVPIPVKPYVTHVPRYALRSAAGPFGEQIADPNEIAEWVEVPVGLRVGTDMFACEVYGRSMEPLVASGSLCMFRKFGAGSRENKRVLVEDRSESNERYTLKVYHSRKAAQGDEGWVHESIELEPLNPEFPVLHLELDQDRYAVVAEFVCVL
jgi:SOS-response transcriptional repressor LexA